MARVRSPNYPSISLPAALNRVRKIHAVEGCNEIDRTSFVEILGYSGITGPSAKLLSTLGKYGLITKTGAGEIKISELAMDVLFAEPDEKAKAIVRAANSPTLFAELNEKWPERQPSDENLRSYLARKGFSVKVLSQVISAYQETMSLVSGDSEAYDASNGNSLIVPEGQMQLTSHAPSVRVAPAPRQEGFDIGFVGTAIRMSGVVESKVEAQKVIDALTALKALLPEEVEEGANASDKE